MYVYAFVDTVPGAASQVAAALVRAGAERAVEVTGPYDVIARFAKITWDEWAEFKNGPSQISGIISIKTAVVTQPSGTNVAFGPMPFSDPKWGPSGLVLMSMAPAEAMDAWKKLSRWKKDGTIKAMVALLGSYDIMMQIAGKDENDISGKALKTLADVPEVRSAVTCLILRGIPASNYKTPRGSAADKKRKGARSSR